MPDLLVVHRLTKRYGATEAVRGLSFAVAEGEIFGLLGPNGAGKTSTLECLAGLREPDAGEITVAGLDLRRAPRDVRAILGATLQTTALRDSLTPREALRLFGALYPRRTPPEPLLQRFNLADKADAPFATLSGGQRQRLALALAFVNQPKLVLLDEPAAGLDPLARRDLQADILRLKDDGHTVLLSTHDLDEAERLCDRVAVLHRGEIVALGPPRDLVRSPARRHGAIRTLPALDPERVARLAGIEDVTRDGTLLRFGTRTPAETLAALATLVLESRVELISLEIQPSSLEETFLALTASPAPGGDA